MISAYCCCLGDESEAAAEVPLAQVLPDKHEAADLFAAMDGHAPEVGFFVVPLDMGMQPKPLGLDVDNLDSRGSLITGIHEGLIDVHNLNHPQQAVRPFDSIIGLNGTCGPISQLLRVKMSSLPAEPVAAAPRLMLGILRPDRRKVRLVKPGELGVQLKYTNSSTGIVVSHISEHGLIADWNASHPETSVCPGDRIIEINGRVLNGREMLEHIRREVELEMTVLHYPDTDRSSLELSRFQRLKP